MRWMNLMDDDKWVNLHFNLRSEPRRNEFLKCTNASTHKNGTRAQPFAISTDRNVRGGGVPTSFFNMKSSSTRLLRCLARGVRCKACGVKFVMLAIDHATITQEHSRRVSY